MIRITKVKTSVAKVGFTLLEVILSVAIMLVLTTMMMNGFAATMSYSYHTSVFASTAGSNYADAITNVATNSASGRGAYTTMGPGYGSITDNDCKKIHFSQAIAGTGQQDINVQMYRENGGASDANSHAYRSEAEDYGEAADGTYANNRTAFYYYPKYIKNGSRENTRGKISIYQFGDEFWWYDEVNNMKMFKAY